MKAKDYFEKYRKLLYEVEDGCPMTLKSGKEVFLPKSGKAITQVVMNLADEFVADFNDILGKRKIRMPSAMKSLVEEFNDKWNALVEMFVTNYGEHVLKRNGFRAMVVKANPELGVLYQVEKENEKLEKEHTKGD